MSDDLELLSDAVDDDGNLIDADIALVTAFLARELTDSQTAAVHDRLENNIAFREKVLPLVEGWLVGASGDTTAIDSARDRARRVSSLTAAEIDAGWKRYNAVASSAHTSLRAAHVPSGRNVNATGKRFTFRKGASIGAIVVAAAASILLLMPRESEDHGAAPGSSPVVAEEPFAQSQAQPKLQLLKNSERAEPGIPLKQERTVRDSVYERLVANLDVVTLTISVSPFASDSADPGGGLRSAVFHVGVLRMEPHAQWPDGSYVSGASRISTAEMQRVIEVLDSAGVLASAARYYSERTPNPQGPPPAAKEIGTYFAARPKTPFAEFRLSYYDENYYTNYIILPSLEKQFVPLLTELRRTVADSATKVLLTRLLATATLNPRAT